MKDVDMYLEHAKNDYDSAVIQHGAHSEEAREARAQIAALLDEKERMGGRRVKYRMYKCKRCGYEKYNETNHTGLTYSWGHYHTCPKCPPFAKYPEYGGSTTWEYVCELEPQPHRSPGQVLEAIERLEAWGFNMTGAWNALAERCL